MDKSWRLNKKNKVYRLLLVALVIATLAVPVWAQAPFVNCIGSNCTFMHLLAVPVRIFNGLLGLAGLVLIAVIVWGGARMMLYYFSEMPEAELINAKKTITRGIFGFLIVATAYLIVNILVYRIFGLRPDFGVGRGLLMFGFLPI